MKMIHAFALAVVFSAGVSGAAQARDAGIGFERSAPGYEALQNNQLDVAERQLLASAEADRTDPAVLLNLGQLYLRTGRPLQALRSFERAAGLRDQYDIELSDGRIVDSQRFAQQQSMKLIQQLASR
jgi:tetratricopeptide (TPR) repeat protein